MRQLTVGKLKKILEQMPNDALVVRPNFDHSYINVHAEETTALVENASYGLYTEDHGEEYYSPEEAENLTRIKVLVIS